MLLWVSLKEFFNRNHGRKKPAWIHRQMLVFRMVQTEKHGREVHGSRQIRTDCTYHTDYAWKNAVSLGDYAWKNAVSLGEPGTLFETDVTTDRPTRSNNRALHTRSIGNSHACLASSSPRDGRNVQGSNRKHVTYVT
jgi:hypothetical protein